MSAYTDARHARCHPVAGTPAGVHAMAIGGRLHFDFASGDTAGLFTGMPDSPAGNCGGRVSRR